MKVGEFLRNSEYFKHYKIYQEYPVNKVNPKFLSGRHKFDWYVKDLNLVIEVHGQQHFSPICFGGISEEEADRNLARQIVKDAMKEDAALNANATYIVIRYDEEINDEILLQKILNANEAIKNKVAPEFVEPETEEVEPEEELTKQEREKEKRRRRMEEKKKASERRKLLRQTKRYQEQQEKAKKYRKTKYKEYKARVAAMKKRAK